MIITAFAISFLNTQGRAVRVHPGKHHARIQLASGSGSDWEVDSLSRSMVRAKVKLKLSAYYNAPPGVELLESSDGKFVSFEVWK